MLVYIDQYLSEILAITKSSTLNIDRRLRVERIAI